MKAFYIQPISIKIKHRHCTVPTIDYSQWIVASYVLRKELFVFSTVTVP
jgi:hypothetical protein